MNQELKNFLDELKKFGIENNIPNVTEKGGRFLNMLVKISKAKSVLEIGSANGYSTIWLADAVRQNSGKLITIDFSKPTYEFAKQNLEKAGLSDVVEFNFGNALEIIPSIKQPRLFDFVFVDGEKRSYWKFWETINNLLEDNAIVVFDDVLSYPHKTEDFMKKIKDVVGFDQEVLPLDGDDGILILYKN